MKIDTVSFNADEKKVFASVTFKRSLLDRLLGVFPRCRVYYSHRHFYEDLEIYSFTWYECWAGEVQMLPINLARQLRQAYKEYKLEHKLKERTEKIFDDILK